MSGVWIRSQDGLTLEFVSGIYIAESSVSTNHIVWSKDDTALGEYATEARAREVLDCIQRFIVSGMKVVDDGDHYSFEPNPQVFTMPRE